MTIKSKLKWALGSLAGLALVGCLCNPQIQRIVIRDKPAIVVNLREENKKRIYDSALREINSYFRGDGNSAGFVDFMAPYSKELRDNLKAKGKEEVIKGYEEVHKKCLDLGVLRLDLEISKEDISDLAERLVVHMRDNAKIVDEKQGKGVIDYEHPAVKAGYESFGRERAGYFQRVIKRNLDAPPKDFKQAVRNAYTKEEFAEESKKYAEARKKMYESFAKSTENFRSDFPFYAALVRAFAPIVAEKVRKASDVFNSKDEKKVYP